jgi:hypothetical protein
MKAQEMINGTVVKVYLNDEMIARDYVGESEDHLSSSSIEISFQGEMIDTEIKMSGNKI